MTIQEVRECIEKMKKVYPFDEKTADIRIGDYRGGESREVTVTCFDEETETRIMMNRIAE